jgi:hypothetical protein
LVRFDAFALAGTVWGIDNQASKAKRKAANISAKKWMEMEDIFRSLPSRPAEDKSIDTKFGLKKLAGIIVSTLKKGYSAKEIAELLTSKLGVFITEAEIKNAAKDFLKNNTIPSEGGSPPERK